MAEGLNRVKEKGKWRAATPEEIAASNQGGKEFIAAIGANEQAGASPMLARSQAQQQIGAKENLIASQTPEAIARAKLEQQAAEANVTQALLQQELAKQNIQNNPSISPAGNQNSPAGDIQEKRNPLVQNKFMGQNVTLPQPIEDIQQKVAEGTQVTLKTAAQIFDTIQSALFASKSTGVKKAEAAFTDAAAIIDKDIAMVKAGQKPYSEALRDFQLAKDSIGSLESETKGLGKINLRYWLDNGAEIEAQILREKRVMENQEIELRNAGQAAQLNQARASFGLTPQ